MDKFADKIRKRRACQLIPKQVPKPTFRSALSQSQRHEIVTIGRCGHFGDVWAAVMKAIQVGLSLDADIIFTTRHDRLGIAQAVINLVDSPVNIRLEHQDEHPARARKVIRLRNIYHCNYTPTKIKWKPGPYKRICYQFDGRWNGGLKNPPKGDAEWLLSSINGVEQIRLGLPMKIHEIVETIARCDLFVGVDSGMAHVCHSVGIPMFLIEYNWPLERGHKGKNFVHCKGTADAITKVNQYLQQL